VILARQRSHLLCLAGVVAVLACFAKANAVYFTPIPAVFLATRHLLARPKSEGVGRNELAWNAGMYALGIFACLAVWLLFFILPNWTEYSFQVGRLRDESKVRGLAVVNNIFMFALAEVNTRPRYTLFLTQALLPLGLLSVWIIHTGSSICRDGCRKAISRLSDLERFVFIWIIMFLPYFVNRYSYSSQRYHVFLVPATILGVGLLRHRWNEELSLAFSAGSVRSVVSSLLGSLLIALPFVLYLRLPILRFLEGWMRSTQIGDHPGPSIPKLATLATFVFGALFVVIFPIAVRAFRGIRAPIGGIAWLVFALLLPIQLIAIGNEARRVSYTIDDATAKLAARIGADARVIEGYPLVFGTKSRYLTILDRRWAGYNFFGSGLVPFFRPTHVAVTGECTEADFALKAKEKLGGWGSYVPGTLRVYHFCHDAEEKMRFAMVVGEVLPLEK
jgi:hypothetical protein